MRLRQFSTESLVVSEKSITFALQLKKNMIELRKTFRKYGETFTQVYNDKKCVIYKRGNNTFEVFKYRIGKPNTYHDDNYEMYPSDESFGNWAWCCSGAGSVRKILEREFAMTCDQISAFLTSWVQL